MDVCAERGLFLANTFFQHKHIHRYTWRRGEGYEQKGLIDYVAVDGRLRKDICDAKVVRGMFDGSDHLAVLGKVRLKEKWVYEKKGGVKKEILKLEKLQEKEVKDEYKREMAEALRGKWESVKDSTDIEKGFGTFREVVLTTTKKVVGMKVVREGKRKGNSWWTEEIRRIVKEKRELFKGTLERNVDEQVKRERKEKYRECKMQLKQAIKVSKERVDEDFRKRLTEKYKENRESYYREVKNERKAENYSRVIINEVMDKNGKMLKDGEAVKERWREYFKNLMNVKDGGPAVVTAVILNGVGGVNREESITHEEVNQAIKRLKNGKAAGIDGITAEMLKYGGDVVTEWMVKICQMAWERGVVPADWTKAIIVPVYKGKGRRGECGSYRGISLLSIPGKVYGKVIVERVQRLTKEKISEEQGGFRKGRGCVDQIFSFRMVVERVLAKGKKLYAAFMDLEKAYDRVDWLALWEVLMIYGVGGKLLSAVKSFYEEASACVKISGETSEHFEIKVGLRQGCVMSPWLFNIYMDGVMREMKGKVGEVGVRMYAEGRKWMPNSILFADDTVLIAENESDLQNLVIVYVRGES